MFGEDPFRSADPNRQSFCLRSPSPPPSGQEEKEDNLNGRNLLSLPFFFHPRGAPSPTCLSTQHTKSIPGILGLIPPPLSSLLVLTGKRKQECPRKGIRKQGSQSLAAGRALDAKEACWSCCSLLDRLSQCGYCDDGGANKSDKMDASHSKTLFPQKFSSFPPPPRPDSPEDRLKAAPDFSGEEEERREVSYLQKASLSLSLLLSLTSLCFASFSFSLRSVKKHKFTVSAALLYFLLLHFPTSRIPIAEQTADRSDLKIVLSPYRKLFMVLHKAKQKKALRFSLTALRLFCCHSPSPPPLTPALKAIFGK